MRERAFTFPDQIDGRYRSIRRLGAGGMGEVWEVEHVHTRERLAMKVLLAHASDAVRVERFKREARTAAKIKSDHVVGIVDAGAAPELGGAPYLVMPLLEGEDLKKRLAAVGRLAPADAFAILRETASGLEAAHRAGIVHRDVKPENVFLHRSGDRETVKILDFGISRFADEQASQLTATGDLLGTPFYMSPEQARGEAHRIGATSDVWALGLVAYRMLVGSGYWQATSVAALMVDILSSPMPPPSSLAPELPRGFDTWFARSCDRDPAKRFPSVTLQVEALEAAYAPARQWASNKLLVRGLAGGAGLAAAAMLAALIASRHGPLHVAAAGAPKAPPSTALSSGPDATAPPRATEPTTPDPPLPPPASPEAPPSAPAPSTPRRTAKGQGRASGAGRPPPAVDPDKAFLLQYR